MQRIVTLALAGLLAGGGTAAAQCPTGLMTMPPAGSWAQYQMKEGVMRMAILGKETRDGKESVWLEMSLTGDKGPMIMQMLVPGWPYETGGVQELIIKAGNQPAMRMSRQMLGMMRNSMPKDVLAEACRNGRTVKVGDETITVPAGTFQTEHYRDSQSQGDVWVSREVPFAMVRARTKDGNEVILIGRGTDAKSQITETPQDMPGM